MLSNIPKPALYIISFCILLFSLLVGLTIYFFAHFKDLTRSAAIKQISTEKKKFPFVNDSDSKKYENIMVDYLAMEDMAKGILPVDTTLTAKQKSLSDIKDIGIYYWTRNLEVLESLKELNMPKQLIKKTELLKEYCLLNKACYELIYKAVDERTQQYNQQIDGCLIKSEEKRNFIRANY